MNRLPDPLWLSITWSIQVCFRLQQNPWADPERWKPIRASVEQALAEQDVFPGGRLTNVTVGFEGHKVVIDGHVIRDGDQPVNPLEGTRHIIEIVRSAAEEAGLSGTGHLDAVHYEPIDDAVIVE
jgi:hypothetical protein